MRLEVFELFAVVEIDEHIGQFLTQFLIFLLCNHITSIIDRLLVLRLLVIWLSLRCTLGRSGVIDWILRGSFPCFWVLIVPFILRMLWLALFLLIFLIFLWAWHFFIIVSVEWLLISLRRTLVRSVFPFLIFSTWLPLMSARRTIFDSKLGFYRHYFGIFSIYWIFSFKFFICFLHHFLSLWTCFITRLFILFFEVSWSRVMVVF